MTARGLELAERGRASLRHGQSEEAEDLFRQAVAAGHVAAASDLFRLLKAQGREEEALAWRRRAAEAGEFQAMTLELDELIRADQLHDAIALLNAKDRDERLYWTAAYVRNLVAAGRPDEAVTCMRPVATYEHYGVTTLVQALQAAGQTDEVLHWLDRLVLENEWGSAASHVSEAVEFLAANGASTEVEERLRDLAADSTPDGQIVAVTVLVKFLLARRRIEEALPFLQRRAAFATGTDGCSDLVLELRRHGRTEQIEPLLEPIARGELGHSRLLARRELGKHLLREGRHTDAERWLRPNAEETERPNDSDVTNLGAALIGQGRFREAAAWLYRVHRNSNERVQLLVSALVGDGRREEAELMLYRLAESGTQYGIHSLVEYLRQEGRDEEAESWLRRLGGRSGAAGVGGGPSLETIVVTATITSAVVPFIQSLAAEAAKDAYQGVKSLIRRLCGTRDGAPAQLARDRPDGREGSAYLLRVRDPEQGITLHVRSDVPVEAIQELQAVEVTKLVGGRDDADPVQLFWDSRRRSWRVIGPPDD